MKFFVVFALLFVSVLSSPFYVPPGEITLDTYEEFLKQQNTAVFSRIEDGQRIATGTAAKTGEYPDFCYLSINFYQKQQTCGCFVVHERFVATSARCLRDCSEGVAANVTVTIPALSGAAAVNLIDKIFIPDGVNGMAYLTAYPAAMDGVPAAADMPGDFRIIKENNVAVIRLSKALVLDPTGKTVNKAKMTSETTPVLWQTSHKAADGWKLRACGIGVINNLGERAKGVTCTEVNWSADCKEHSTSTALVPPTGQICLLWPDRDNNVCVGDFGGPVYAYKLNAKGDAIDMNTQETVCILVGSPNVRSNAQCLDGHITYCTFLPGAPATIGVAQAWITAITMAP